MPGVIPDRLLDPFQKRALANPATLKPDGRLQVTPDHQDRYLETRGHVAEDSEAAADEHINKVAKKRLGVEQCSYRRPGGVLVLVKTRPAVRH